MRAARLQNWKLDWYQFKDAKKWKQCSKLAVLRDVWELINPKGLLFRAYSGWHTPGLLDMHMQINIKLS